jgi:uncharacterized protein YbjT (DUF2867 family)
MILVTGAAGKTGRTLIRALTDRGEKVRSFVKSEEQDALVRSLGASEAFVGNLLDQNDLAKAVKGIRAVYHICPNMHPEEIRIGQIVIAACEGGVERFVYHSVFRPQIEAMPHHWNKLRVEEMLFSSGLNFTILQPTAYMQNTLARLEEIKNLGLYRVPYSVQTRISMVDLLDVAEVAAAVLTESGYEGGTYELIGSGFFSQEEIAAYFAKVLGISVHAEEIPLAEWKAQAELSELGDYAINTLIKMFTYYDKYNFRGNLKVLESLLGRRPTSFEDFLRRSLLG